jgi:hypothetical protein
MKDLFEFTLALLGAGYPAFALILIIAIALWFLRPIHFSFSLGDRSQREHLTKRN